MPANAASQPRMRSSSMAWPTDSWICSAICSPPRISVVSPDGHERRGEQLPGLGGDPGGVAGQVERVDQLPAAGAVLAAGGRVGAALGLPVADRGGRDARRRTRGRAGRCGGPRWRRTTCGCPRPGRAPSARSAPCVAHRRGGPDQQVALVGQRDGERVVGALAGPAALDGGDADEVDRRTGDRRGGLRDGGRPGAGAARIGVARPGRRARRSPTTTRPARGRRARPTSSGSAPGRRRCGRSSTRTGGRPAGRRRTGRRRRARPRPRRPRRRRRRCRSWRGRQSRAPSIWLAMLSILRPSRRAQAAAQRERRPRLAGTALSTC